jgi:hypothetical protein
MQDGRRNGYIKKTRPWESLAILADLTRDSIEADDAFIRNLEESFWIELATEYDAEHFCEYLRSREAGGTLHLSEMFCDFERIWRRDELNHVRGFARVFSVLYSIDEMELFSRLRSRKPSFRSIEPLLADEFAVCVVLAYDELATTRSYQYDMIHRYPKFGNPALVKWIGLVAKDEAWHFENTLRLVRRHHSARIPEVAGMLDKLVKFDATLSEYGATFVLDHSANSYNAAFLDSCRSFILRRLLL